MLILPARLIGFVLISFNFVSSILSFRLLLMAIGLSVDIHLPFAIATIAAQIRNTPSRFKTGFLLPDTYCAYKAARF
jgi:hypothetical protein